MVTMAVTTALVRDTFREALARKIFWGLFSLSTFMILFFLFLLKIDVVAGAMATMTLFGNVSRKFESQELVRNVYGGIAAFLYTWGLFLAVFASAGLVPSLLEPGRIELLLSKPVGRVHLLLGRYLGNILVVGSNIVYLVAGVWLIVGVKTSIWSPGFLYSIATTLFLFAVLLTVVVLLGVAFESGALATMVCALLMILSPILAQTRIMDRLLSSEWARQLWKGIYYALPKTYDVGRMTLDLVRDRPIESLMPLWSSALFAAVVLGIALVIFTRKDY